MAHPAYLPTGITPEMYERTRESLRRYLAGQDRALLARCLSEAQSPPTPCMTHSTSPADISASEDSADDDADSLAPLLAAAAAAHQHHNHRPSGSTSAHPNSVVMHPGSTPTKPRLANHQPMDFGIVPSTPAPENVLPGTPPGRKGIMERVLGNADYLDNQDQLSHNLSDSNDSEYDNSQRRGFNISASSPLRKEPQWASSPPPSSASSPQFPFSSPTKATRPSRDRAYKHAIAASSPGPHFKRQTQPTSSSSKHRSRASGRGPVAPSSSSTVGNDSKPSYSYAGLIGQAIFSTPKHRISLNDIYIFLMNKYPFFKREDAGGWQNSIRHNLSLNDCFIKTPRTESDSPGKGHLWTIRPGTESCFKDGGFKKSQIGLDVPDSGPTSSSNTPSHVNEDKERSASVSVENTSNSISLSRNNSKRLRKQESTPTQSEKRSNDISSQTSFKLRRSQTSNEILLKDESRGDNEKDNSNLNRHKTVSSTTEQVQQRNVPLSISAPSNRQPPSPRVKSEPGIEDEEILADLSERVPRTPVLASSDSVKLENGIDAERQSVLARSFLSTWNQTAVDAPISSPLLSPSWTKLRAKHVFGSSNSGGNGDASSSKEVGATWPLSSPPSSVLNKLKHDNSRKIPVLLNIPSHGTDNSMSHLNSPSIFSPLVSLHPADTFSTSDTPQIKSESKGFGGLLEPAFAPTTSKVDSNSKTVTWESAEAQERANKLKTFGQTNSAFTSPSRGSRHNTSRSPATSPLRSADLTNFKTTASTMLDLSSPTSVFISATQSPVSSLRATSRPHRGGDSDFDELQSDDDNKGKRIISTAKYTVRQQSPPIDRSTPPKSSNPVTRSPLSPRSPTSSTMNRMVPPPRTPTRQKVWKSSPGPKHGGGSVFDEDQENDDCFRSGSKTRSHRRISSQSSPSSYMNVKTPRRNYTSKQSSTPFFFGTPGANPSPGALIIDAYDFDEPTSTLGSSPGKAHPKHKRRYHPQHHAARDGGGSGDDEVDELEDECENARRRKRARTSGAWVPSP